MKRLLAIAAIVCVLAATGWAQVLDKPAATVRLIRTDVITVGQLQKVVASLQTSAGRLLTQDERKLALNTMVEGALIEQAADRDKIVVSDAELKSAIDGYRKSLATAANLGRDLTDAEFAQYLRNNNISNDEFTKQVRDSRLRLDYVMAKKKGLLDGVKPVADQEASDYYDAHKSAFFVDDIVVLRHIFVDTRTLTTKEEKDKAAKRADDILKELKGGAAFPDLVLKYSDDAASKYKGGDIGALSRSDAQRRQLFGSAFFDAVFKLKQGETSGVIPSNLGFHIVQVANRYDAQLLSLDDKIPPTNQNTVREYIKALLLNQRQNDAMTTAANDLVADLKKQAEIHTYDDNLSW